MKSLLFIVPLLLLLCFSACEKKDQKTNKQLGLGFMTVNTSSTLYLYKNENDAQPTNSISFKFKSNGKTKFVTDMDLNPYELFEGNSEEEGKNNIRHRLVPLGPTLRFRVMDSTKNAFKIIINEENFSHYYLRRSDKNAYYLSLQELRDNSCSNCPNSIYNPRWNVFETWERYLKRVAYASKKTLIIYDNPDGKIIFNNSTNSFMPFKISRLKGDWVKIGNLHESDSGDSKFNGWTQWKQKNEILIDVTEELYE